MNRLPSIVWLQDRRATERGDIIDTPALRGFAMMESAQGQIYREDIVVPYRERFDHAKVSEAVAKAWKRIAAITTLPGRKADR